MLIKTKVFQKKNFDCEWKKEEVTLTENNC